MCNGLVPHPQVAAIYRLLCSLCCVTPDRIQAVADLGHANSNQGSTTRGGCTQPTQWAHLKYPAWVIGEAVPLDRIGHLLYQVTVPCLGDITALPNTYRNKHREAAKMKSQRNMAQMTEQNKTPKKELNKMEISNLLRV